MYYITFEAVQDPSFRDLDPKIGGAFINAYIRDLAENAALTFAKKLIKESGWVPIQLTSQGSIDLSQMSPDDDNFDYINQALTDGDVLVIHSWPIDSP